MKFCKSLQRIAAISDPSYAPYWTNYKLLKKLIKAIISGRDSAASVGTSLLSEDDHHAVPLQSPQTSPRLTSTTSRTSAAAAAMAAFPPPAGQEEAPPAAHPVVQWEFEAEENEIFSTNAGLRNNPREVAFFRLVHAEVVKAQTFFDKVERECSIRAQVVSVGMEILNKPQACLVRDRWSVISRAIFFLYRDLLLLETFAIMTYFSFSKILKKHDKVTGFTTRDSFMVRIVNKANFTNYPRLLSLIARCQTLYTRASEKLAQDLHEDERLFLNMVSEWNTRHRDANSGSGVGSAAAAAGSANTTTMAARTIGQVTDGLPSPRVFASTTRRRPNDQASRVAAAVAAAGAAAASVPRPTARRSQRRSLPLAATRQSSAAARSLKRSRSDDDDETQAASGGGTRTSPKPHKKRSPKK